MDSSWIGRGECNACLYDDGQYLRTLIAFGCNEPAAALLNSEACSVHHIQERQRPLSILVMANIVGGRMRTNNIQVRWPAQQTLGASPQDCNFGPGQFMLCCLLARRNEGVCDGLHEILDYRFACLLQNCWKQHPGSCDVMAYFQEQLAAFPAINHISLHPGGARVRRELAELARSDCRGVFTQATLPQ